MDIISAPRITDGENILRSHDTCWLTHIREVLKAKIPGPLFFVFNILFISLAQSILLFLVTTPTYVILLTVRAGEKMATSDSIFARVLLGLVLLEWFADQQQWGMCLSSAPKMEVLLTEVPDYQEAKRIYRQSAKVPKGKFDQEDLDRGFVVSGLWSWSRHPNFAAEQTIWVVLYQWGCWTSEVMYNWTFLGAMSYLILFQASTWFTELITAGKYPDYAEYQQRVGKFLPKLTSSLPGNFSDKKHKPAEEKAEKKKGNGKKVTKN